MAVVYGFKVERNQSIFSKLPSIARNLNTTVKTEENGLEQTQWSWVL